MKNSQPYNPGRHKGPELLEKDRNVLLSPRQGGEPQGAAHEFFPGPGCLKYPAPAERPRSGHICLGCSWAPGVSGLQEQFWHRWLLYAYQF